MESNETALDRKKKFTAIKKEHDRQLRDEYKAARTSGENSSRRMYFFDQILKKLGYSYNVLAERSGFSSQLIGWWLVADDCKYSNLVKVLKSINVGIEPTFEDKDNKNQIINVERCEVRGTLPPAPKKQCKNEIGSEILKKRLEEGGNLKFLAEFIRESGITLSAFSRKIKTDYTCFRRWLTIDDIPVSKLYQIAEAFDKKIIWNITDLTKEK